MLTVQNIHKSYGIDPVLANINFTINAGERWGLVGINGSGKTTLLKILVGDEKADVGSFRFSPNSLRIGYLSQGFEFLPNETIDGFVDRVSGNEELLTKELELLASRMMESPNEVKLQTRYDQILGQLALIYQQDHQIDSILSALELDHFEKNAPVAQLSGGQKTRLMLAGVLLSNPQLLILDEPTNHLDISMLSWLEDWLNRFSGGVLLVSHDRTFLDKTVSGILELDEHTHEIKAYAGNYSDYLEEKMAEKERQWQAFKDQQEEISRLRNAASEMRSKAKFRKGGKADPANTDGFSVGFFANRTKETVQKAKNIEKRIEKLLTEDRVDKPQRTWQMRVDFSGLVSSGQDVLIFDELSIGYKDKRLLESLDLILRQGERVALIGPNGSGKTSLLKTVMGEIPTLAGEVRTGANVKIGYMTQEQKELDPERNALDTILHQAAFNETEARSFLSKFLFKGDEVFTPVAKMSFGERARLSLACMVASGCNFLILDEPVNHLDIPSRTSFEQALTMFEGTVLAVVHDRFFIEGFATQIWEINGSTIQTRERL